MCLKYWMDVLYGQRGQHFAEMLAGKLMTKSFPKRALTDNFHGFVMGCYQKLKFTMAILLYVSIHKTSPYNSPLQGDEFSKAGP